jgi:uncharacterized repeat protein (TIGR02543 family)
MKKFTLMFSLFVVFLLAGCENPIYQWLLPEKKDPPTGPLDINGGWNSSSELDAYARSLRAWGGDRKATLDWSDPGIEGYDYMEIYYSDSYPDVQSGASSYEPVTAQDQPAVIEGLTNGKPYYFAVTPMNRAGGALGQTLIISATPHAEDPERPDDVENLVCVPGSRYARLTWNLPASHQAAQPLSPKRVTSVSVSVVPVEGTVDQPDMLGAHLSGLQNLKPYSVYIRTVNAAGKRSYGVSAVLIPRSASPAGGIIWMGPQAGNAEAETAHGGLEEGLAYYNTGEDQAYVYTGGAWKKMTDAASPAGGIIWVGPQTSHQMAKEANGGLLEEGLAYYNTGEDQAWVYTNGDWEKLTATPPAGIIWKGSLGAEPAGAVEGWAYYNTVEDQAYVHTGGEWKKMTTQTAYHWVRFDSRGGSFVSPQLVAKDGLAHEPLPGPSRSGFAFDGWHVTAAPGSALFGFTAGITGPVTVYAHWTPLPETLLDDFPYGSTIHGVWYIHNEKEWKDAVKAINDAGNGTSTVRKNYILHIASSFKLEGVTAKTFDPEYITVAIRGSGTEVLALEVKEDGSLLAPGSLLFVGSQQQIKVRGLVLKGHKDNPHRLVQAVCTAGAATLAELWLRQGARVTANGAGGVWADNYAQFTMDGNAEVSGNHITIPHTGTGDYTGAGVLVENHATLTMRGSASVSGNSMTGGGGTWASPTSHVKGAGVAVKGSSTITMEGNASVSRNSVAGDYSSNKGGGGVSVVDHSTFTMTGYASVFGNILGAANGSTTSGYGGGVYIGGESKFTMNGAASVSENKIEPGGRWGGGVYVGDGASSFKMRGSASVSGNTASYGGGISVGAGGILEMAENSTVSGNRSNTTNANGTGVWVNGGKFTMTGNAMVANNLGTCTTTLGGGVYLEAAAELTMSGYSSVSGNEVRAENARGGGIYISQLGTLTMTGNASVSGNKVIASGNNPHATAQGGGICLEKTSGSDDIKVSLYENSSISGNSAVSPYGYAWGGGVFMSIGNSAGKICLNLYSGTVYGEGEADISPEMQNTVSGASTAGAAIFRRRYSGNNPPTTPLWPPQFLNEKLMVSYYDVNLPLLPLPPSYPYPYPTPYPYPPSYPYPYPPLPSYVPLPPAPPVIPDPFPPSPLIFYFTGPSAKLDSTYFFDAEDLTIAVREGALVRPGP